MPPAQILSHYTSLQGFYGIARSQTLRVTDISSVNDTSEMFFAASILFQEAGKQVVAALTGLDDPEVDKSFAVDHLIEQSRKELSGGGRIWRLVCYLIRSR